MKITDLNIGQLESAANMLKAIAHPMRIAILSFLEDGKRLSVTEIYEKLQIEQSTTSHHLGILKDKGDHIRCGIHKGGKDCGAVFPHRYLRYNPGI